MMTSVSAPRAQRPKATPKGVRKPSEYLMKRNEHPHVMPSTMYVGSHEREGADVIHEGYEAVVTSLRTLVLKTPYAGGMGRRGLWREGEVRIISVTPVSRG